MARRRHGSGSVYHSDGRWIASFELGRDADGKRQRRRVTATSKSGVITKLDELQRRRDQGQTVRSGRVTVSDAADAWMAGSPQWRPWTRATYQTYVNAHIKPALGHIRVEELEPRDVQQLLDERARTRSPRRVQGIKQTLGAILRYAQGRRWVNENVARLANAPRGSRTEVVALSKAEVAQFLAAVRGDRLEPLWRLAVGFGLRQEELLGLKWEDIDDTQLTVRRSLKRLGGKQIVEDTKRSRILPLRLPASLAAALREHRESQQAEREFAAEEWEDGDWVFTGERGWGRPLNANWLSRKFKAITEPLGISATFKTLRHTCASRLLAEGVPLPTISGILGHTDYAFTRNTYAHLAPELHADAAEAVDRVLGVEIGSLDGSL